MTIFQTRPVRTTIGMTFAAHILAIISRLPSRLVAAIFAEFVEFERRAGQRVDSRAAKVARQAAQMTSCGEFRWLLRMSSRAWRGIRSRIYDRTSLFSEDQPTTVTNASSIRSPVAGRPFLPFDGARIASFRSRSSRTDGQNAIRVALPSEAWLPDVSLRASLRQTLRYVPPLHSASPTFRPKRVLHLEPVMPAILSADALQKGYR